MKTFFFAIRGKFKAENKEAAIAILYNALKVNHFEVVIDSEGEEVSE